MNKRQVALLAIASLCWISTAAEPPAPKHAPDISAQLEVVLARLEEKAALLETLTTDFIQEKHLAVLDQPLVMKGTIFMQQPKLFAWHVTEPLRYSLVIKDEVVRQWDGETGRVQNLPLSKNPALRMGIAQMRGWFSGAYRSLLGEYEVTVLGEAPTSLRFVPRQLSFAQQTIASVTIVFGGDERYIRKIRIREKGGDLTLLSFEHTLLNEPIDPSAWNVRQRVQ